MKKITSKFKLVWFIAIALILISAVGVTNAYYNNSKKLPSITTLATEHVTNLSVPFSFRDQTAKQTTIWVKPTERTIVQRTSTTAKVSPTVVTSVGHEETYRYAGQYGDDIHPVVAYYNPAAWELLLVRKDRALPLTYLTSTVILSVGGGNPQQRLDVRVASFYIKMYNDANRDGVQLIPYSGYRTIARQKQNYERKIRQYQDQGFRYTEACNLAAQIVLPPGCSEHEAGLAMDIVAPGRWSLDEGFADTKEFAWLTEHAQDYGFVLRYPKSKTKITGVDYEPWHWRYVGVSNARIMSAESLCLEEYLTTQGINW
jgi:D-alanyl-D-alanine carboxypeptidase